MSQVEVPQHLIITLQLGVAVDVVQNRRLSGDETTKVDKNGGLHNNAVRYVIVRSTKVVLKYRATPDDLSVLCSTRPRFCNT